MSQFYIADIQVKTADGHIRAQFGLYEHTTDRAEHFIRLEAIGHFPKVSPLDIHVSNVRTYDREAFINSDGLVD